MASICTRFPNALALQSVPSDPELWKIDNYENFLTSRRKLLATEINVFLEGITASNKSTSPASIDDVIAEGESDELEFKSSLRWDYKQGVFNRKLEDVVVKSIAAFTNGQGGTLLIGINDEGTPLGLERDYATLDCSDRDKFEVHLRNLLKQNFGEAFVTTKVRISFPLAEGIEICQIDISQAQQPIVVKATDKHGQVSEKFYVRSGNSSLEMPMSEMHSYISERFS